MTTPAWNDLIPSSYKIFDSPLGIHGMARILDKELRILAVTAKTPGRHAFDGFIAALQKEFDRIYIIEVWNSKLAKKLRHWGWIPCKFAEEDGTPVEGYKREKL